MKYVVGPFRDAEPISVDCHSDMPTHILRYADILLIYAEAVMNGTGSTSDASAVAAFNLVHERAGLAPVTSITMDDILHERKVEFAFEGDYWFDIQRQGRAAASAIVSVQDRGTIGDDGTVNSEFFDFPAEFNMFLPIPQGETVINPLLLGEPQSYDFGTGE